MDFIREIGLDILAAGSSILVTALVLAWFLDISPIMRRRLRIGDREVEIDLKRIEDSYERIYASVREIQESPRVFISYSSGSREFVRKLVRDLASEGIRIWVDEEQIRPGDSIGETIKSAIASSQWFLVVISGSDAGSAWMNNELERAMDEERARGRNFIVPALYDGRYSDIPNPLKDRAVVDFRLDYDRALSNLVQVLRGREEAAERAYWNAIAMGIAEANNDLGLLLARQPGREEEAEAALRRAMLAQVDHAALNLGLFMVRQGRLDEAESLLRQAASVRRSQAKRALGLLMVHKGWTNEAESLLRQAIDEGDEDAYGPLGNLLISISGGEIEAEHFLRKAIARGDKRAYTSLAELWSKIPEKQSMAVKLRDVVVSLGAGDYYDELQEALSIQGVSKRSPTRN